MRCIALIFITIICCVKVVYAQNEQFFIKSSDTIKIKGIEFIVQAIQDSGGTLSSTYVLKGIDTILKFDYIPADIQFADFNNDSFTDILFIHYPSNTSGVSDLYLFDYAKGEFIEVLGFRNFPEPQRVANTKYYYSYHRSSCADYNWDSDLFYIKDYRAVKIANIHAVGCDDEPQKGVYIFDLTNQTPIQVDFIKMKKIKANKWCFIQNYWTKNYKKFLKPRDIK